MNTRSLSARISESLTFQNAAAVASGRTFIYNAAVPWKVFMFIFWSSVTTFFVLGSFQSSHTAVHFLGWSLLLLGLYKISNIFRDKHLILETDKVLIPKSTSSRHHYALNFNEIKTLEVMNGEELVLERSDGKYLIISEYMIGRENFLIVLDTLYEGMRKFRGQGTGRSWKRSLYELVPWVPVILMVIILLTMYSSVIFKV